METVQILTNIAAIASLLALTAGLLHLKKVLKRKCRNR